MIIKAKTDKWPLNQIWDKLAYKRDKCFTAMNIAIYRIIRHTTRQGHIADLKIHSVKEGLENHAMGAACINELDQITTIRWRVHDHHNQA